MSAATHPTWCNRRHQAGASPERQEHENVWRSSGKILPVKVQTYPTAGGRVLGNGSVQDPGSFLFVSYKHGQVRAWLTSDDMRALAERLNLIADVASSMGSPKAVE